MTTLFMTILRMSAGGAFMALLVIGARAIVARRSGPFLPILYALLMLRLALPFSAPSPLSLQNLLQLPQTSAAAVQPAPEITEQLPVAAEETLPIANNNPADAAIGGIAPLPKDNTAAAVPVPAPIKNHLTMVEIAAIIWLAGAGLISVLIAAGNIRFALRIKRNRMYDEPNFAELIDECKEQLGLRRHVMVLQSQGLSAAAVYGVLHPKLLISPASFMPLSWEQKRHVLLHELSHIRRHDTAVCLLAVILSIVHWFNPLVWLSFALMRRDIEVLCDDSVVKALGDGERHGYAATLLALVSPPQTPKLVTALFISNSGVKKRIMSIARRKKASVFSSTIAIILTVIIAFAGCTSPGIETPSSAAEIPTASSALPSDGMPSPAVSVTSDGRELLTTLSYSISDDTMADSTALANIDKAVNLMNGLCISGLNSLSMTRVMNTIKWTDGSNIGNSDSDHASVGKGVDIVAQSLYKAAQEAGLQPSLLTDHPYLNPDLIISNPYSTDITLELSRPDNMINVSIYSNAQFDMSNPSTSYTFDFSSYTQDTARIANIKKAASTLNGLIVRSGKDNHMISGWQITAENGWDEAPTLDWPEYQWVMNDAGWTPTLQQTQKYETNQTGGGIDLVLAAIYKTFNHASLSGIDLGFLEDSFGKGGDLIITSDCASNILMQLSVTDTDLTVTLYEDNGADANKAAATPSSTFTVEDTHPSDPARVANIERAAAILHGVKLGPGDQLSLNDLLGPRTTDNGWQATSDLLKGIVLEPGEEVSVNDIANAENDWKTAAGILDSAYSSEIGGGVDVLATAVYNAALRAGLKIEESTPQARPTDYVDGGMDVTISAAGSDLKISNPYAATVTLAAMYQDHKLTVSVYGPVLAYDIDFTSTKISETATPETVYHYNASATPDGSPVPKGGSVEWVSPRPGFTYNVTMKKSLEGAGSSSEDFSTVTYPAVTGQVYVNEPDPAGK
jgi:beta-lactamase regulating signal transducer with metallopeptidase domain/vancomycin resistance protein YoaR